MKPDTCNDVDHTTGERPDTFFATLAAGFAPAGHTLHRTHADRRVSTTRSAGGLVRVAGLADARRFLTRVGRTR